MNVSVYNARYDDESVEDLTFESLAEVEKYITKHGAVQFNYDDEQEAITLLLECKTCEEFICNCDDDVSTNDLGDDEEEEE